LLTTRIAPKPFETDFSFSVPDLDHRQKHGYFKLFQAAWEGDLSTIKQLTLEPWKSEDGTLNPPLKIAIQDIKETQVQYSWNRSRFYNSSDTGLSPFSIAVLRGHQNVASAIVEIAQAQYQPENDPNQRKQWKIQSSDDSDNYDSDPESDDSGDDERPRIFSQIVSDAFTIENVAAVSNSVKSQVSPLSMIQWTCKANWFRNDDEDDLGTSVTLMNYAIRADDMLTLKFLLKLGAEQTALAAGDEPTIYAVPNTYFHQAIRLGRTSMLSELVTFTGVGLPFKELVKTSGVEIKETPKYYQGLNVGGKKRTDWAQAGREVHVPEHDGTMEPPLLVAAHFGSIEAVEWFLSDAPARTYKAFANNNNTNKRIMALEQSKTGFDKTIGTWLNARSMSIYPYTISEVKFC
jgi:hypothetical protein